MQKSNSRRMMLMLAMGGGLLLLIVLLLPRPRHNPVVGSLDPVGPPPDTQSASDQRARPLLFSQSKPSVTPPAPTAEETVARKVSQFVQGRRKLAHAISEHFKVPMLDEVERFFDAAEAGRYEEMHAIYKALRAKRDDPNDGTDFGPQWRTIIETEGAVREAHDWPAQKLLDYGEAVLGALRPGMIYVGGTDPGCFIPTMLNETSEGERRIVFTQNALADSTYLDYLNYLYGDRLSMLTHDDSKRLFEEYSADARERLEHDQQFPDEPKQIRPGENIRMVDGTVKVSGQVSVMAINEKLFQLFMERNPDASFAMEESFPFKSMFGNATPLGPVMELRVQDEQNALTPERAAQSADYWRTTAEQLLADAEAADSRQVRMAYSKLASSQAGLLLERGYTAEAEQSFRYANEIAPASPEAVFRYVNLLVGQNRVQDALPIAENAARIEPANKQFRNLVRELQKMHGK
jgi:hypothetical protein